MGQSFEGLEYFIQFLLDIGLLDALGDTATDIISQYSENMIMLLWNLFLEMLKASAVFLVGVIIAAVVFAVVLVLFVASYIFRSIGLMRIAKKLGVKHRFLAWIPVASDYLVGVCAEKSIERDGKKAWKWGMILIITFVAVTFGMPIIQTVVSIILSILPALSVALNLILNSANLIYLGLYTYCLFRIYKEFTGTTGGVIFALLSLFMGLLEGVFTFVVSCFKLRPAQPQSDADVVTD